LTEQESNEAVIDLGGSDDPSAVAAMLQSFYDGTYSLTGPAAHSYNHHFTMYRLADFYDAPALREMACSRLINSLNLLPHGLDGDTHVGMIQKILGPNAHVFADKSIQKKVFDHVVENTSVLYQNQLFLGYLVDGVMFEESFAREFMFTTGQVMVDLKKKSEYVSSQRDPTHRLMFLRLTDIPVLL
jgi:hypothetical protein